MMDSNKFDTEFKVDYNLGFDDGVEYVLGLMDTFINHSVIVGMDNQYIRPCEDMLEDIRNTIDEQ